MVLMASQCCGLPYEDAVIDLAVACGLIFYSLTDG